MTAAATPRAAGGVQFADPERQGEHQVPAISDYTPREFKATWWSHAEYDAIFEHCEQTAQRMERENPHATMSPRSAQNYCVLGLEHWTRRGTRKREINRKRAFERVMDEQDAQWAQEEEEDAEEYGWGSEHDNDHVREAKEKKRLAQQDENTILIAHLYAEVTAKSQTVAATAALQLEAEVNQILATTRAEYNQFKFKFAKIKQKLLKDHGKKKGGKSSRNLGRTKSSDGAELHSSPTTRKQGGIRRSKSTSDKGQIVSPDNGSSSSSLRKATRSSLKQQEPDPGLASPGSLSSKVSGRRSSQRTPATPRSSYKEVGAPVTPTQLSTPSSTSSTTKVLKRPNLKSPRPGRPPSRPSTNGERKATRKKVSEHKPKSYRFAQKVVPEDDEEDETSSSADHQAAEPVPAVTSPKARHRKRPPPNSPMRSPPQRFESYKYSPRQNAALQILLGEKQPDQEPPPFSSEEFPSTAESSKSTKDEEEDATETASSSQEEIIRHPPERKRSYQYQPHSKAQTLQESSGPMAPLREEEESSESTDSSGYYSFYSEEYSIGEEEASKAKSLPPQGSASSASESLVASNQMEKASVSLNGDMGTGQVKTDTKPERQSSSKKKRSSKEKESTSKRSHRTSREEKEGKSRKRSSSVSKRSTRRLATSSRDLAGAKHADPSRSRKDRSKSPGRRPKSMRDVNGAEGRKTGGSNRQAEASPVRPSRKSSRNLQTSQKVRSRSRSRSREPSQSLQRPKSMRILSEKEKKSAKKSSSSAKKSKDSSKSKHSSSMSFRVPKSSRNVSEKGSRTSKAKSFRLSSSKTAEKQERAPPSSPSVVSSPRTGERIGKSLRQLLSPLSASRKAKEQSSAARSTSGASADMEKSIPSKAKSSRTLSGTASVSTMKSESTRQVRKIKYVKRDP